MTVCDLTIALPAAGGISATWNTALPMRDVQTDSLMNIKRKRNGVKRNVYKPVGKPTGTVAVNLRNQNVGIERPHADAMGIVTN